MLEDGHLYGHDWRWSSADGCDVCRHCHRHRGRDRRKDGKICQGAVKHLIQGIDFGPTRCSLCGTKSASTKCNTVGCPIEPGD